MSEKLIYVNVNEEAVPYDSHDSIEAALKVLDKFPNDMVAVAYADSHIARTLSENLP